MWNGIVHRTASDLSCVIFDIDGTLTRTNQLIFASFNHVAQKYVGKTLSQDEIIALFGPPEEGGLLKLVGPDRVEPAMNDLCAFYRLHHSPMASLHVGMDRVLTYLKEKDIRLAVYTGKGNRTAGITLDELKLTTYFDLIVSGSDVKRHKPDPEGIRTILQAFGLTGDRVLMVGDSVSDVLAARGAGVRMASVLWDAYDRQGVLRMNPDTVFHRVEDLESWLHHLLN